MLGEARVFALGEGRGRRDPETGEMWTLAWVRTGSSRKEYYLRWREAFWPGGCWASSRMMSLPDAVTIGKDFISRKGPDRSHLAMVVLHKNGGLIYNENDLLEQLKKDESTP